MAELGRIGVYAQMSDIQVVGHILRQSAEVKQRHAAIVKGVPVAACFAFSQNESAVPRMRNDASTIERRIVHRLDTQIALKIELHKRTSVI
jgi:hypothetical protein